MEIGSEFVQKSSVATVVLVKGVLGLSVTDLAVALAAFGGGSMVAALILPRLLERIGDRSVMISAASALPTLLFGFASILMFTTPDGIWSWLLIVWASLGICYSATQLPSGRLLRRSSHGEDRPAIFAAQFALSHACWLITYPLAGWLGSATNMPATLIVLASVGAFGALTAARLWPSGDPKIIVHDHPELPPDHPHMSASDRKGVHAHDYIIDDLHLHWHVTNR